MEGKKSYIVDITPEAELFYFDLLAYLFKTHYSQSAPHKAYKTLEMAMVFRRIVLFLLAMILLMSTSCENRHSQEQVVSNLIESHFDVTNTMDLFESTKFYKNTILKSTNPDSIWSEHFFKFYNNYSFEKIGPWFDAWYYKRYNDIDNLEATVISIINNKEPSEILEFHFKGKNDKWYLIEINYRYKFDF